MTRASSRDWAWITLWAQVALLGSGALLAGLVTLLDRALPDASPRRTMQALVELTGVRISTWTVTWTTDLQLLVLAAVGLWLAWQVRSAHRQLALGLCVLSALTALACWGVPWVAALLLGPPAAG